MYIKDKQNIHRKVLSATSHASTHHFKSMTPTENIRVFKKLQKPILFDLLFSLKMGLLNDLVPLDAEFQVELEDAKNA